MARVLLSAVVALLVAACLAGHAGAVMQCIGDDGRAVDWWAAFKYPQPDGRQYSYVDANNKTQALAPSWARYETGYASGLNYTLSQIYGKPANSISYVLFNDQPATTSKQAPHLDPRDVLASTQKAHAKGIVAMDNQGNGFWLLHSVPLFPLSPLDSPTFQYMDDSQTKYAQSFLCVSFSGWDTFNQIGYQLQVYKPQFYQSSMSTTMQSSAPNLYDACEFGKYENSEVASVKALKSKGGMSVSSFAKTGYWGEGWDMYDEFIAPTLAQGLYVETWRQGSGGPLPSNCTAKYPVMNIDYVNFSGETWKYTADHSKWAISGPSGNWVCICGVNRMASQGKRGGGGMCFQNTDLHSSIAKSVTQLATCP